MEHYKKIESKIEDIMHQAFSIDAPDLAPVSKRQPKKLVHSIKMGPGRPRPSGFPYCPVRHVYKDLTHKDAQLNLKSSFYLSVGAAAHLSLQRFVALTGHCLGNYGCPKCGLLEIRKSPWCPKCSTLTHPVECEYHEIEAQHAAVYAHIDGLFDLGEDLGLWVVDYKTASLAVRNSDMLPYMKNQHQCSAYVPIVERKLKRKVAGFALVYVPRDNPTKYAVHAVPMTDRMKDRSTRRTLKYSQQAEVAHAYIKSKTRSVEALKLVIDQRLCKNRAACDRHEQSSCVLAPVCVPAHPDPNNEKLIHFFTKEI